jgi:hypothetical protein
LKADIGVLEKYAASVFKVMESAYSSTNSLSTVKTAGGSNSEEQNLNNYHHEYLKT